MIDFPTKKQIINKTICKEINFCLKTGNSKAIQIGLTIAKYFDE